MITVRKNRKSAQARTHEEAYSMERDDKVNLRKEDEKGAESGDDSVVARRSQRLQNS